jgi:hypothetical protein
VRFEERRRTATRELGSREVRIGRDPTCDWIVDYANVSRHHAVVRPLGDRNVVQDLGSTNGIRVNGHALGGKPHVLAPGDTIELTEAVVLLYEEGPFSSSTPWVVTAVAMVVLLVASIGLYLTTRPADAPGRVRAGSSGPDSGSTGTHPGMPSAQPAPDPSPSTLPRVSAPPPDARGPEPPGKSSASGRETGDWRGLTRVQSSGEGREGGDRPGGNAGAPL